MALTKFDPDKAYLPKHVLDAICTFSFDERLVMKYVNTLYETRYSNYLLAFVQKQHLVKVILFANISIGPAICIKNNYNQHLHIHLSGAQFYNLTRFRMGLGK